MSPASTQLGILRSAAGLEAIRTTNGSYVEYATGEREYYDLLRDPYELRNTFTSLPADARARLHASVAALSGCAGSSECRRAGRVRP